MFTQQKKLPSVAEIKAMLPLDDQLNSIKLKFDEDLRQNMQSKQKLVVVCGPCSADDPVAVGEYVSKLKQMRGLALADVRSFLLLYEEALLSEHYLAADGYREQHKMAEGRLHALDAVLALVAS